MRKVLFLILYIPLSATCLSAQKDSFAVRTKFENQGDQENYWAQKLFHDFYKKETYKVYQGKIYATSERSVSYDSTCIFILNNSQSYLPLFSSGILYPGLFSLPNNGHDTLTIGLIEELPFFKLSPKTKRLKIWYNLKRFANPFTLFIELTNESAIETTSLKEFIKGSSLTFFKLGWVVL